MTSFVCTSHTQAVTLLNTVLIMCMYTQTVYQSSIKHNSASNIICEVSNPVAVEVNKHQLGGCGSMHPRKML